MTTTQRTDADWTIEGRASLGHEILDLAPAQDERPCYTGWYAWKLCVEHQRQATMLRPLMDRMTRVGLLEKTGGVRVCNGEHCWRRGQHTHSEACNWRLAMDRHEAHERWSEVTTGRWWAT